MCYCYLCQYRVGGGSGELRQLPHVALAGAEGGSDEGRARSGIQRRWWGNVELPDRPPSFGMGLLEFVIWWATTAISGKRWRSAALDRRAAAPVAAGCGEGSARVRRCAGDGGEVQVATGNEREEVHGPWAWLGPCIESFFTSSTLNEIRFSSWTAKPGQLAPWSSHTGHGSYFSGFEPGFVRRGAGRRHVRRLAWRRVAWGPLVSLLSLINAPPPPPASSLPHFPPCLGCRRHEP